MKKNTNNEQWQQIHQTIQFRKKLGILILCFAIIGMLIYTLVCSPDFKYEDNFCPKEKIQLP